MTPFGPRGSSSSEDAPLAAELRRLATELERGEIDQVVITVIRRDGGVERLGTIPAGAPSS